jgi:hypothetical protein
LGELGPAGADAAPTAVKSAGTAVDGLPVQFQRRMKANIAAPVIHE